MFNRRAHIHANVNTSDFKCKELVLQQNFFFSLCCFNGPTNEALNVQLEKQKPRPKNEIFKGLFNCDLLSGRWGLEYRLNDEKQPWLGSNKLLTVNRQNKT